MKIAILGAPTAGKTDVAKRMARALNRDGGKWKVIDGYVPRLTERTGVTYDTDAGYLQNLQILCERLILEDEAAYHDYHTISCGSIYDTITYSALLNVTHWVDEQARLFQAHIIDRFMGLFPLLEATLTYDHLFYLPWQDREHEHSMHAVINAKLPDILTSLNRTATVLTGSRKQQVQDALKVTRFIRDNFNPAIQETILDQQPTV